ncbi:MAG: hypothetical protein ACYTKD_29065 [Planctomycetota bacterium]|jgi:hypothetical protein
MSVRKPQLDKILRIAHETSMRGAGLSLMQALAESGYSEARRELQARDFLPLLQANSQYLAQWVLFSEDKRTSGGWYLIEDPPEIGRLHHSEDTIRFATLEEAVAEFVVHELDSCMSIQKAAGPQRPAESSSDDDAREGR